jgi:MarR-like DNA-binding transcriptional regulator SgrR of sgrS sRNA
MKKMALEKKDGQILELNLLTTDSNVHNAFSSYLKENMGYLGVKVNINKTNDFNTQASFNNYDLALYKKNIAINGTDRTKYLSSKSFAPKGFNYSRFDDARVNTILNNPSKVDNVYYQRVVSDVLKEELPTIPLYNYTKDIAVSARVNNFKPNMVDGNTWNSTEWWIN